jgi:hypothetical protein
MDKKDSLIDKLLEKREADPETAEKPCRMSLRSRRERKDKAQLLAIYSAVVHEGGEVQDSSDVNPMLFDYDMFLHPSEAHLEGLFTCPSACTHVGRYTMTTRSGEGQSREVLRSDAPASKQ